MNVRDRIRLKIYHAKGMFPFLQNVWLWQSYSTVDIRVLSAENGTVQFMCVRDFLCLGDTSLRKDYIIISITVTFLVAKLSI
jgi:hypothetical protein